MMRNDPARFSAAADYAFTMPDRVPIWARPGRGPIAEPFTWLSVVLRLVALPVMALLWWAVAFLSWQNARLPLRFEGWPPTVPIMFTDLEVAVFGPIGASLVVVALVRRGWISLPPIVLGFLVSAILTLTSGVDTFNSYLSTRENQIMLGVCAVAALAGWAIGAVATRSLLHFGFLGLLAVSPVVSLITVVVLGPGADRQWLTRLALAVLMVMIAWVRWARILAWPLFLALFWLLTLVESALAYAARTLGSTATAGAVAGAMADFVRSAWREVLGVSWQLVWPAAVIAALVISGWYLWSRFAVGPDLSLDH